jgi:hypothetical protein
MRLSTELISRTSVSCLPRPRLQNRLPKNTWQQNVPGTTFLCCLKGLIAVLLALVVSTGTTFSYESAAASFPEAASPTTGPLYALSDLDGDGLPDVATVSTGGLQEVIELQLSRVNAPLVLPFSPTPVSTVGVLSMQDVDHDGDTDLLWKDPPPSHRVVVWLNDGTGRFECLCPPDLRAQSVSFGRPGVNPPYPRTASRITTPEQSPTLSYGFAASWKLHVPATPGRFGPAPVWGVFAPPRVFSTRGPPPILYA